MDGVTIYLNNILAAALKKHGVSEGFLQYTLDTIRIQMLSLLRHWDDYAFRSTVLLFGLEEGSFYEPPCKNDIRCFVVVTLRNSPFEALQSDAYASAGLHKALLGSDVKAITSEAIRYFSKQDFSRLCSEAKKYTTEDFYLDLSKKYPISWQALRKLAASSAKSIDYPRVQNVFPYNLKELELRNTNPSESIGSQLAATCFDGYSPEFDSNLLSILTQMESSTENSAFIVDSFKSLTRNAEKLLKIMEFLLSRNVSFVTSNFYIENGHVECRIKPLRAGHTFEEMENNLRQYYRLGSKHKAALKHYFNQQPREE